MYKYSWHKFCEYGTLKQETAEAETTWVSGIADTVQFLANMSLPVRESKTSELHASLGIAN